MKIRRRAAEQGFTLIEILVAVVIMGLAYVAVLQNFSLSARNIIKMEEARQELLVSSLAFERQILSLGRMDEDLGVARTLVEGRYYRLLLIADKNDNFVTLKLESL